MTDPLRKELASWIASIRQKGEWTQREMGQKLDNLPEATISRWEAGKVVPNDENMAALRRLARTVGVEPPASSAALVSPFGNQRGRERIEHAMMQVMGVAERTVLGTHVLELLEDGSLRVNGSIVIAPDGTAGAVETSEGG